MNYVDQVYGSFKINEPIVLDLLASPTMLRLKKIDQTGFLKPFRPKEKTFSRFDHSIGVFLLLRYFNGSLEEQIAGLIHDVSHTVFSHCADYLGSHENQKLQTHQDDVLEAFITNSDIPSILAKHNLDLLYILNNTNFSLKETTLPDICADRIDYSLRTALSTKTRSKKEVLLLLQELDSNETQWFFISLNAGLRYTSLFSCLNKNHFASLASAVMLHSVRATLRYSIDKGHLTHKDFYTTDEQVLQTLSQYTLKDPDLQNLLLKMYNKIPYTNDPSHFQSHVFCKSRIVNPLCLHEGYVDRLSCFHTD